MRFYFNARTNVLAADTADAVDGFGPPMLALCLVTDHDQLRESTGRTETKEGKMSIRKRNYSYPCELLTNLDDIIGGKEYELDGRYIGKGV